MAIVPYTPEMGNILGDAWRKIKSDPLILAPQFWLMKETWKAVPELARGLKNQGQEVVNAFRPPQPPQQVDAISSGLQQLGIGGGSGGEPGSSSTVPILVGGAAAAVLLLLAFGRKKRKT